MVAKGLDFSNVTVVGVVNADHGLHIPDFRSSEKIFQLIYQVPDVLCLVVLVIIF